jgi:hypothetical protein
MTPLYIVRIGQVFLRADSLSHAEDLARKGGKLLRADGMRLKPCVRKPGSNSRVIVSGKEVWA